MSARVSSDLGGDRIVDGKRLKSYAVSRSRFVFRRPTTEEDDDEDRMRNDVIVIEHATATALEDVGLQVWIGSLLLADYLFDQPLAKGSVVLELGAGSGLTAMALASTGCTVFATDYDLDTLCLLESNASSNCAPVRTKLLDWRDGGKFKLGDHRFLWSRDDFELLTHCRTVVAADCIYDLELNKALFSLVESLIRNLPIDELLFSIDERVNFDADTQTVASPAYDDFVEWLERIGGDMWRTSLVSMADMGRFFFYERPDSLRLWRVSRVTYS